MWINEVIDFFEWLLPYSASWFGGAVFAMVVFGLLLHLKAPRRGRKRLSLVKHFTIILVCIILFIGGHSLFVHEGDGGRVLGGFIYQDTVEKFLLVMPDSTTDEVISAFGGWTEPEAVWTLGSLIAIRVFSALLVGTLMGSLLVYVDRVPKIHQLLERIFKG